MWLDTIILDMNIQLYKYKDLKKNILKFFGPGVKKNLGF
jgi:hypothetical protein